MLCEYQGVTVSSYAHLASLCNTIHNTHYHVQVIIVYNGIMTLGNSFYKLNAIGSPQSSIAFFCDVLSHFHKHCKNRLFTS